MRPFPCEHLINNPPRSVRAAENDRQPSRHPSRFSLFVKLYHDGHIAARLTLHVDDMYEAHLSSFSLQKTHTRPSSEEGCESICAFDKGIATHDELGSRRDPWAVGGVAAQPLKVPLSFLLALRQNTHIFDLLESSQSHLISEPDFFSWCRNARQSAAGYNGEMPLSIAVIYEYVSHRLPNHRFLWSSAL